MKTLVSVLLLQLLALSLFSQTNLSGVINQYAKVSALDPCSGKLSLTDASSFSPGDRVLLIQMQGALIDQSNGSDFGSVLDVGSAGLFEKNEIASKNGDDIFLKYFLLNDYDAGGSVQLVSFPVYSDAVVADTLKAAPWNGATGGILAFEVENTLSLEAPIDLSGQGFRGGLRKVVVSGCTFLTNAGDYYYDSANWRGSAKGEGIAAFIPDKEHGRGAQANGGGGGNDHNSGGGGGANGAPGGLGGKQTPSSTFGCYGNYPGRGGKAFPIPPGRIFMGGGGGSGHTDDTNAGSSGGNGGGILILRAGTISGDNQTIAANGATPPTTGGDGGGGGGAAGAILIEAQTLTGSISIEAVGGNGGNVNNPSDRCFGPGGGGSGGWLLSNLTTFASVALTGGQPGLNSTLSSQCNGLSNEATAGANGIQNNLAEVPASTEPGAQTLILQQPQTTAVCEGEPVVFSMEAQGVLLSFQWQINNGAGWSDLTDDLVYSGAQTQELHLAAAGIGLNGSQYRCLLSGPCTAGLSTTSATLTVTSPPLAGFSVLSLGNGVFQFQNASTGATTYVWSFGDGTQSSEASPVHTFSDPGNFTVSLTAEGDCGEDEYSQQVTVVLGFIPQADFYAPTPAGCAPLAVQFQNQSAGANITSFFWEFEAGNPPNSTDENPLVTYSQPGTYDVSLTVENDLGEHTLLKAGYVTVFEAPQANFYFSVDGYIATFFNASSGASGYFWLFGDGNSSSEQNPVHVYQSSGLYDVVLSVANGNCGSAISHQVRIGSTAANEPSQTPPLIVFPNPVGEEFYLLFSDHEYASVSQARLWDGMGRLCRTFDHLRQGQAFSMTGLAPGIYLLQMGDHWQRLVKL